MRSIRPDTLDAQVQTTHPCGTKTPEKATELIVLCGIHKKGKLGDLVMRLKLTDLENLGHV